MNINDVQFVKGFTRMAFDGWEKGWHERNGGNLSYRIKDEEVESIRSSLDFTGSWQSIGANVKDLSGEFFLVTGSGKFFRNMMDFIENAIGIIEIDDQGESYRVVWGLTKGGKPTSELPTHLMNHAIKKRATDNVHRVIYHAHTTNLIALSFVLPLDGNLWTHELWEMATECPVVFPEGVGIVPWMVPGGREIAVASSELMRNQDVVIWAHHGTFCSGEDFDLTFGLMDTVEKAAEILVKVKSMSNQKLQTIKKEDFIELAKAFNIEISEDIFG